MKQRIITAAVGLALLLIVLLFFNTLIFNAAVSLLACMAALEILVSAKYASHKLLTAACLLFVAAVPFFRMPGFNLFGRITVLVYLVILFLFLLAVKNELRGGRMGYMERIRQICKDEKLNDVADRYKAEPEDKVNKLLLWVVKKPSAVRCMLGKMIFEVFDKVRR